MAQSGQPGDDVGLAHLGVRKAPRQARSRTTVGAIFEATAQVARKAGVGALTTTRVSERAGVSVGSFYQYFPHKDALLVAFLDRHMTSFAAAMERLCEAIPGGPLEEVVERLARGYARLKVARADDRRVFYDAALDLGMDPVRATLGRRIDQAVAGLLARASDMHAPPESDVSSSLMDALRGAGRGALDDRSAAGDAEALEARVVEAGRRWAETCSSLAGCVRG